MDTRKIAATLLVIGLILASTVSQAALILPIHRYGFDEAAGTNFADSIDLSGTSDITLVDLAGSGTTSGGQGHAMAFNNGNGSEIRLYGGGKNDADWIQVGSDGSLINTLTGDATIEFWVTTYSAQNWSRVFSFGSANNDVCMAAWSVGTNINQDEVRWYDANGGVAEDDSIRATMPHNLLGTQEHLVFTFDVEATGPGTDTLYSWYQNGVFKGSHIRTDKDLVDLQDGTEYSLGRSKWNDSTADASYNEFRIYDYAMPPADVILSRERGPDKFTVFEPSGVKFYWDGFNEESPPGPAHFSNWGHLAARPGPPATSHWYRVDPLNPPDGYYPDAPTTVGDDGDEAYIYGGYVTVAAAQSAYSVEIGDPTAVGPAVEGALVIAASQELTILDATTVNEFGSLTINGILDTGSIFSGDALAPVVIGNLGNLTTQGNSDMRGISDGGAVGTITVEPLMGAIAASHITLATDSIFVKAGGGALSVAQEMLPNTMDATNTVQVDGGELSVLAIGAANPIGGATLKLNGGKFTAEGEEVLGTGPGLRGSIFLTPGDDNAARMNLESADPYTRVDDGVLENLTVPITGPAVDSVINAVAFPKSAGNNIVTTAEINGWGMFPNDDGDHDEFITAFSGLYIPATTGDHSSGPTATTGPKCGSTWTTAALSTPARTSAPMTGTAPAPSR